MLKLETVTSWGMMPIPNSKPKKGQKGTTMCNNCIHKAVCSIYRATGGVKKCEHFKEERKGEWLETVIKAGDPFDGNSVYCFDVFACSECGCHFDVPEAMNYCPNCGCRMGGD
jgi:hypothetical protein